MNKHIVSDPTDWAGVIYSRHAAFTMVSCASRQHYSYTYDRGGIYIPYAGTFRRIGDFCPENWITLHRHMTNNKSYARRAQRALSWLDAQVKAVQAGEPNKALQATLMHHGKCGKCGRPLSNPESIRRGIGPICMARL